MTPQFVRACLVLTVLGVMTWTGTSALGSEDTLQDSDTDETHDFESANRYREISEGLENLDVIGESEINTQKKEFKRDQGPYSGLLTLIHAMMKRLTPKEYKYSREAPYPSEAPYPKYGFNPMTLTYSDGVGLNLKSASDLPVLPPVATDIDIRRAIPFENEFITRQYTSKVQFPPTTLGSSVIDTNEQVSQPFKGSKFKDITTLRDSNLELFPYFYPVENNPSFLEMVEHQGVQSSPSFPKNDFRPSDEYPFLPLEQENQYNQPSPVPAPNYLPISGEVVNQFRNEFPPPQEQLPGSIENFNAQSLEYPPRFISWTPPNYDQFAKGELARPPTTGFNVEVSEVGEPAFIVPEDLGKVDLIIPPPLAPLRTHGLSINDPQITRNEVRKDNGEFLSSYTTSEGTSRTDSGSLVPTADGDQVLVLKGSYSFTSPEGPKFRVDYTADQTGYHATMVPIE